MSYKHKLLLFGILFIGLFLRLYGNNWDQGFHLHPDERFLTMVGTALKIPSSFNPAHVGYPFFVYGTFPLLINKLIAQFLYNDTYDLFHLQGRVLSGLADFFVLIIIYKLVELIEKKLKLDTSIKYLSTFLYAIAVLPIQLSHFFAVDTFLNFFCWASFYFAVKFAYACNANRKAVYGIRYISLSGIFLGLALASKVSALYFAPLVGIFVLFGLSHVIPVKTGIQPKFFNFIKVIFLWIPTFVGMTLFLLFTYLALRLGSPHYFETGNIFNLRISTVFINNIKTLKSFDNPQMFFPPANQWVSAKWYLSPLNLAVFGVGPFFTLFALIGYVNLWMKKNKAIYIVLLWAIGFFTFQSMQYAKTMRYLLFIYPLLAIFAAVGVQQIILRIRSLAFSIRLFIYSIICISIFYWPLAFMSIYMNDHTRVIASQWIYKNIPSNSVLTYEYWDDPLPLAVQDPSSRNYKILEIHIFDPDTKEKWKVINDQLNQADYYIMSSNRGWRSIPKTPERYPIASGFYKRMFEGKAGYTLIKQFSSYPSLRYLGIPLDFPDQWAEEAFTVYDHPEVVIFRKN